MTFVCVSSIRTAALITSSRDAAQSILFSSPSQLGLFDAISAVYYTLIGQRVIDIPGLLSSTIAQSVALAITINATLAIVPVPADKMATLRDLQQRAAGALYTLQHLRIN